MGEHWDLWIRGGTLVDGTGAPGRVGDVAIRDGRIAAGLGKIDVAKVLLKHNASLTIKNNEGKTALDLSQRPVINEEVKKRLEEVHALLVAHAESQAKR